MLVTGANGRVGKKLVKQLVASGNHEVSTTSLKKNANKRADIEQAILSIRVFDKMGQMVFSINFSNRQKMFNSTILNYKRVYIF
jgi:nucleoside-diphosphate-sugar epimerase